MFLLPVWLCCSYITSQQPSLPNCLQPVLDRTPSILWHDSAALTHNNIPLSARTVSTTICTGCTICTCCTHSNYTIKPSSTGGVSHLRPPQTILPHSTDIYIKVYTCIMFLYDPHLHPDSSIFTQCCSIVSLCRGQPPCHKGPLTLHSQQQSVT